jgi:predicted anti-sigma-YlaC factor YlaD
MSEDTMSGGHTDVGAYSLGLLEQQDREAFEEHLAVCPSCAAELAELTPVAELLRGIEPVEAAGEPPAETAVTDLIRRRAARQRRRDRWQVTLAAAAGIVLLAGGIGVGIAAAAHRGTSPPPAQAVTGQRHHATDTATGVAGTVGLVAKAWGTQITLDLSRISGPLTCDLVAVSRTGKTQVALSWMVPAAGEGVPGHPAHLIIEGGTAIPLKDLTRLDINVVQGSTLLSIPV